MDFVDTTWWNVLGVVLFVGVLVVIGLNITVFRDKEEVEEEREGYDIQDLC